MSRSLHSIIVGAALASLLGTGQAWAQQAKDPAAVARDLTLYDELLRMRVIRGTISVDAADEMLRLEAIVLMTRGTSDKVHRGMVAAEQREANTFFLYVEHVVATAPHWPADLPAEQYRAEAEGLMSGLRPGYAQAMAADQDPVESLAIAYRVLRLASGDKNMLFAKTPFELRGSQVAAAMSAPASAPAAPTPVAAARPAPPAPQLGPGPAALKPSTTPTGLSVVQVLQKAGLLGSWAIACGDPASPANPHAKRYITPTGSVVQLNETAPDKVTESYEFKTAELQADGKVSATLESTSTHKPESVIYQLNNAANRSGTYRVWYRQNGDGIVLVRDGAGTVNHQPLPPIHRCP